MLKPNLAKVNSYDFLKDLENSFLLKQSKDVLMILTDQSSGNPLELVINLVMIDKNNQIYKLSENIFPELPLLMIPKMEKITS